MLYPCALSPWEQGWWLPAVCCLLWLEIKAWLELGMDWGRLGGDVAWHGMAEVIQRLEAHHGFVPQTGSHMHWFSLRKWIRFSWRPLPCHQPNMCLLILTRCACATAYNMTPPPANLAIPPFTKLVYFGIHGCNPWKQILQSCSKCDNINNLPEINKAAVHSP